MPHERPRFIVYWVVFLLNFPADSAEEHDHLVSNTEPRLRACTSHFLVFRFDDRLGTFEDAAALGCLTQDRRAVFAYSHGTTATLMGAFLQP